MATKVNNYFLELGDIHIPCGRVEPIYNTEYKGWWINGEMHSDAEREFSVVAEEEVLEDPAPVYPTVTPTQFKLLFTSRERLAINAARQSDLALDDFCKILDDPRLTGVDMNLESNQKAIGYALMVAGAVQNPAYTDDDVATRKAAILSGQVL